MKVFITCEHGGNYIPKEYSNLFKKNINILSSHRGYDLGAMELAREISKKVGDYFIYSKISRLLVEMNRSENNRNLFSEFTEKLNQNEKDRILIKYYFPYRTKVESQIRKLLSGGNKIIHLSVHSFTPVFKNKVRNADIGILFDPKRKSEKGFAVFFKNEFSLLKNNFKVRFNYPYLGISDGLTSYLRKKFNQKEYIGIELEVNQKFVLKDKDKWKELKKNIRDVFTIIIKKKTLF